MRSAWSHAGFRISNVINDKATLSIHKQTQAHKGRKQQDNRWHTETFISRRELQRCTLTSWRRIPQEPSSQALPTSWNWKSRRWERELSLPTRAHRRLRQIRCPSERRSHPRARWATPKKALETEDAAPWRAVIAMLLRPSSSSTVVAASTNGGDRGHSFTTLQWAYSNTLHQTQRAKGQTGLVNGKH